MVEVTTVGGAPPTATQFVAVGHETPERVPTVHGIVCFVHDVPPFVVANTNGGDVAAAVPTAKQFAADAHDTPVKLRAAPRAGWLVHDDPPSVDTSTAPVAASATQCAVEVHETAVYVEVVIRGSTAVVQVLPPSELTMMDPPAPPPAIKPSPTTTHAEVDPQSTPLAVVNVGVCGYNTVVHLAPPLVVKKIPPRSEMATHCVVDEHETLVSVVVVKLGSVVHVAAASVVTSTVPPVPTATQSEVDGHEMLSRDAFALEGVGKVVHEVPPSVVTRMPTPASTVQSEVDGHDTAVSPPVLFGTGSLVHAAPASVVTMRTGRDNVKFWAPTATHSEGDGHAIPTRRWTLPVLLTMESWTLQLRDTAPAGLSAPAAGGAAASTAGPPAIPSITTPATTMRPGRTAVLIIHSVLAKLHPLLAPEEPALRDQAWGSSPDSCSWSSIPLNS